MGASGGLMMKTLVRDVKARTCAGRRAMNLIVCRFIFPEGVGI